jgi:hypothetical protein
MQFIIEEWIDGYSNCGTKIQTAAIKNQVNALNKNSNNYYQLMRTNNLWFIAKVEAK